MLFIFAYLTPIGVRLHCNIYIRNRIDDVAYFGFNLLPIWFQISASLNDVTMFAIFGLCFVNIVEEASNNFKIARISMEVVV